MVGIVPLGITVFTWWLMKKKSVNPNIVLLILVVIGIVLGATGLFGGTAA